MKLARAVPALLALAGVVPFAGAGPALTIEDAIRQALAHNPGIKVQAFSRDIARANLLTAYGKFDPALNFQRSAAGAETPSLRDPITGLRPAGTSIDTDNYSLSLDGQLPWGASYSIGGTSENQRGTYNAFRDNFATTGGVTVTQPLLLGFGFAANLSGVRIAKADRSISDFEFRQTAIDTVTEVITLYNELAFEREYLKASERSRALARSLLAENEKRLKVGKISEADVTEANATFAAREDAVLSAARSVKDLENRFRQLLGDTAISFDGQASIEVEPPTAAEFVTVSAANDLKVARALRPDYQAMRLGIVKQRLNERAARNRLLPRVDLIGSYGYNGYDDLFATSRRQIASEDYRAYTVGVAVSIPLASADGRGRARAAELARRQAEADLARFEQEIAVDVANGAGQIETTQQRVLATRTALQLAQAALVNETKKLQEGTGATYFVLQMQSELSSAEISAYRAVADQRIAIASYDAVLGRTLERNNVKLNAD
jgi:outer membrane protein TolC